jgi:hypothetical protein
MRTRFRRSFIILSVLGYAFLGGGSSLWALGLAQEAPMGAACAAMGCTCKMERHAAGQKCCCRYSAALLKKFPKMAQSQRPAHGSCELRQAPLVPQEASDGERNLPVQQPHILLGSSVQHGPSKVLRFLFPAASGPSFHPEPPTPIPD